jgi:hypothetical protein
MWIDASAESEAAGGEAATGMASKRTKLPDTNKRKQPDELLRSSVISRGK